MSTEFRRLLRLFDQALCQREPALDDYRRLEAERRRIQRANGFNERGEPLS